MPSTKRQKERLFALWILGIVALNYPFLSLFSRVGFIFKIPILFLYIFLIWALFIGCVAYFTEHPSTPPPLGRPADAGKSD